MADEIIDLTNSPPLTSRSPRSPRIVQLHSYISARRFQFKSTLARTTFQNPNMHYMYQQMAPSAPQLVTQPNVPSLPPIGATLDRNWTPKEHELFMMGLTRYGRGHCGKIARNYVLSKSADEVHYYAERFFSLPPSTSTYSRNLPSMAIGGVEMRGNENYMNNMNAPTMISNLMIPNETPKVLNLFPEEAPFPLVTPVANAYNNAYGSQGQTCIGSTSVNVVDEVDLELHLG